MHDLKALHNFDRLNTHGWGKKVLGSIGFGSPGARAAVRVREAKTSEPRTGQSPRPLSSDD